MNLRKKLIITITIMICILFILPLILTNIAKDYEFMGIMIILFFCINPITTTFINILIGKDIKKLWYIPILFCIVFLISYWIILKEIILDLLFYAAIYLIINIILTIIILLIPKNRR